MQRRCRGDAEETQRSRAEQSTPAVKWQIFVRVDPRQKLCMCREGMASRQFGCRLWLRGREGLPSGGCASGFSFCAMARAVGVYFNLTAYRNSPRGRSSYHLYRHKVGVSFAAVGSISGKLCCLSAKLKLVVAAGYQAGAATPSGAKTKVELIGAFESWPPLKKG